MSYVSTYQAHLLDNLTAGQKAVITAIATFERNGKAWPSVATLAKRASMGVRTCQRHLAALINLGYITRTYRAGHAAVTRLFIGQTPAKLAGEGMPNWHPEPGISESVNQIPAVHEPATPEPGTETANAAFVVSESEAQEQPEPAILSACECTEPHHQAIPDLEHPPITSICHTEGSETPYSASNEVYPAIPTSETATPVVERQAEADQATEYQAVSDQTQDPAMEEWAKIDPMVLLSIMEIRKAKRKAPKPNPVEIKHWYSVALAANWTLPQIAYAMCLRGWSRIDDASWLTGMIPPQMTATGAPAAPAAPKLWQPTPHTPASPSTVAKMKEQIAAMKQRWREEPLKARPMRQ